MLMLGPVEEKKGNASKVHFHRSILHTKNFGQHFLVTLHVSWAHEPCLSLPAEGIDRGMPLIDHEFSPMPCIWEVLVSPGALSRIPVPASWCDIIVHFPLIPMMVLEPWQHLFTFPFGHVAEVEISLQVLDEAWAKLNVHLPWMGNIDIPVCVCVCLVRGARYGVWCVCVCGVVYVSVGGVSGHFTVGA